MLISKAIVSSDDNPMYLEFWDIVAKIWKIKFNIEPVLLYFGDNYKNVSQEYGTVIEMRILNDIPVSTQAQCSRLWYAGQCGGEIVITSDIDMLPLSPSYFVDTIKGIDTNKLVSLNPIRENTHFPMCYSVAKSTTFKEILDISSDWETFMENLIEWTKSDAYKNHFEMKRKMIMKMKRKKSSWFSSLFRKNRKNMKNRKKMTERDILWTLDEEYASFKINEYRRKHNYERIVPIPRQGGVNGSRIDRLDWSYDIEKVKNNSYYDAHSVRPYSEHKETIDLLVATTLQENHNR